MCYITAIYYRMLIRIMINKCHDSCWLMQCRWRQGKLIQISDRVEWKINTYNKGIVEWCEDVSDGEVFLSLCDLLAESGDLIDDLLFSGRCFSLCVEIDSLVRWIARLTIVWYFCQSVFLFNEQFCLCINSSNQLHRTTSTSLTMIQK